MARRPSITQADINRAVKGAVAAAAAGFPVGRIIVRPGTIEMVATAAGEPLPAPSDAKEADDDASKPCREIVL